MFIKLLTIPRNLNTFYCLYKMGKTSTCSANESNIQQLEMLFNKALNDIYEAVPIVGNLYAWFNDHLALQPINGRFIDPEPNGLYMDTDTHVYRKTEVGKEILRKLLKIDLTTRMDVDDTFWLTPNCLKLLLNSIQTDMPKLNIN